MWTKTLGLLCLMVVPVLSAAGCAKPASEPPPGATDATAPPTIDVGLPTEADGSETR